MCFLYVSMCGLYFFFSSCFCFAYFLVVGFLKLTCFVVCLWFFCGSRPPDRFVASTFTFKAFIVGELAQGVNEITHLVPGSKAKVRIVKEEALTITVSAKTGLLRN